MVLFFFRVYFLIVLRAVFQLLLTVAKILIADTHLVSRSSKDGSWDFDDDDDDDY